ncbi:restriction endonuclease subunit S [Lactococcus petauri]|uniref:Restriction endonuclease subunit S n=1 Tax=Lactococcus petauri TaxID=1940789 RepID=A0AAJ2ITV6_9LACT|nr:restriction endonuclease subunit S [Lactococcus petauri]MDT2584603.1 restriction endonuclease subunit S [Lactococcus petauri]
MAKIDDSVKRKVPELRFPGFTDDWEERKLGEVGKTKSGIGFPDAQQGGKQGTPFYKVSDMNNPGNEVVMMNANNYASDSQLKENKWNPINPQNSGVVFAKVGAAIFLDRKRIVDTSFLIDNNMMSYLFDSSWNRYFGKTLFEKLRLSRFAQVGALPSFNGSDVEDIKVMIPEESEQKMIGDMFEKLDDIIALHQRKLDLLKEQKKGYLQKMFPKNGEKVPELRFAGFADDWEQRKLGDEVRIVMGQSPNSENYTDDPNDYILVQGNADMKNGRVLPRVWTTQVTKQAEKDDLILSVRAPVGDIGKTAYDVVIGRGVAAIKGNEFIFQNLGKMKSDGYWTRYSTGSTFESINSTDIKEAIISVPAIEEQDKIGSFFKQLDNTIALHQRKLDLLKEQKKGYLQKMFV